MTARVDDSLVEITSSRAHGGTASDRAGYTPPVRMPWWTRLSVRLSVGVALLYAVLAIAVLVSLAALWTSYRALQDVDALTAAEREAAAIGVAAREQYIHEAHAILTADPVHLGHDRHWAAEIESRIAHLRPMVGAEERALLDTVLQNSEALGETFMHEIFPAVQAGNLSGVRLGHDRAQALMDAMITASDRAATDLSQRNLAAVSATLRRARLAGVTAAVTTFLAALVAIALGVSFVRRIVRPLAGLNEAATRIGKGEFDAVAPATGAAEFEELRTGLERMAAGLREREARLLKAERLAGVGALAAGVAHELNNPLAVMIGYLKTLRSAHVDADVADDLRIVEEEAHQCRRIVEDLLTFAREPRLDRENVDLGALVRSVVDRLARSDELRGRQVDVDAQAAVMVSADGARIAQVLKNLVLNSVAASPIDGAVRVTVDRLESTGRFRVVDEGTGISPRDLSHLFEPFFTRRAVGTGLGLALSHGIVRAHDGTIDIKSVEGEGTTVEVQLPLATKELA